MRTVLSAFLLSAVFVCHSLAQAIDTTRAVGPERGALVVVGGGAVGPEIWQKFIALAGGPTARFVVIPTAQEDTLVDSDSTVHRLRRQVSGPVTVLHTRNPKEADTEAFAAPIEAATGVWFVGGRQWRLADSYLNTRTHRALESLLRRGGVVGGTSAGATIQGSYLVRGDTKGNVLMMGDHQQGLGFLKNTAIDQHVLRRNRPFDLFEVLDAHPDLLGIGLDESTAIVVENQVLDVLGKTYALVYDPRQWAGKPASAKKFVFLAPGQRFDLRSRRILPPRKD